MYGHSKAGIGIGYRVAVKLYGVVKLVGFVENIAFRANYVDKVWFLVQPMAIFGKVSDKRRWFEDVRVSKICRKQMMKKKCDKCQYRFSCWTTGGKGE